MLILTANITSKFAVFIFLCEFFKSKLELGCVGVVRWFLAPTFILLR